MTHHQHIAQAGLGAGAALLMALLTTPAFSADGACNQSLTYNPDTIGSETQAFEPVTYRVDKPPRNSAAGCEDNGAMGERYAQIDHESDGEPINLLSALDETQPL